MSSTTPDLFFREQQQFRQKWLWLLLIAVFVPVIIVFGYGIVQQLVLGQAWGSQPMSDSMLLMVSAFALIFSAGLLWLFYSMALIVEVRQEALIIRFRPFLRRRITYADIKTCEARKYSPIKEYGGWGIRFGRHGRAYNISGDKGAQLELIDGKRIMLGSQHAQTLSAAILERIKALS